MAGVDKAAGDAVATNPANAKLSLLSNGNCSNIALRVAVPSMSSFGLNATINIGGGRILRHYSSVKYGKKTRLAIDIIGDKYLASFQGKLRIKESKIQ